MSNIATEIKEIISEIIEIDVEEIDDNSHFIDDLEVDSLLALEILAAMEKRYKIEIPEEDLVRFLTVSQVIEVVEEKLGLKETGVAV